MGAYINIYIYIFDQVINNFHERKIYRPSLLIKCEHMVSPEHFTKKACRTHKLNSIFSLKGLGQYIICVSDSVRDRLVRGRVATVIYIHFCLIYLEKLVL